MNRRGRCDDWPRAAAGPGDDRTRRHGPPWAQWPASGGPGHGGSGFRPPAALLAVVVAAVVVGWTAGGYGGDLVGDRVPDGLAYALLLGASAVLALRRRAPELVVVVTTAVAIAYPALGYPTTGAFLVPMIVGLHGAMARDRRPWGVVAAATYLASFVLLGIVPGAVQSDVVLIVPLWVAGALIAGEASRARRAFFAEARRRSLEARRGREEEDRRRESEERVRIAREVHDVVSHSIAMINVQAGVAAHLLDENPEQARDALVAIKEASRDALRDLRATLGVLRAVDEEQVPDGLTPTPGLGRLDELAERLEAAGLAVDVRTEGLRGPLPAGVDLAAYRIVQEAVSNVLRHAGATAVAIDVTQVDDELQVKIDDDGRSPAGVATSGSAHPASGGTERAGGLLGRRTTTVEPEPPSTSGNGLRGIRERAVALGGSASAGPLPGGGWRVTATLPVEAPLPRRGEGHA